MSDIQNKYDLFLVLAKGVNEHFQISPVLFGSVGLYLQLHTEKEVDDLDLLLPQTFMDERWEELKKFMLDQGFQLVSEEKHGFSNGQHLVEFSTDEEIFRLTGVPAEALKHEHEYGADFRVLSLRQYLALYQALSEDEKRTKQKSLQDQEKIRLIKAELIAG